MPDQRERETERRLDIVAAAVASEPGPGADGKYLRVVVSLRLSARFGER